MTVASPARSVAMRLLAKQRRRGARARDLLRSAHEMALLGTNGRGLATRLVLGVNVAAGELDRRVDAFVTHAGGLEPRVRDALRLSAFECLYLDTPRQVAVSQGVELVREVQPRAARMANAVLRRVADARPEVDAARERIRVAAAGDPGSESVVPPDLPSVRELCIASGYPEWLVRRLLADLGPRRAAAMCASALEAAPVYVAAGMASDAQTLEDRLAGLGLEPRPSGLPGSWRLGSPAGLAASGLVGACDVVTADLAAQVVCRVAAAGSGRVLEVGQGRGTKSLLLVAAARELGGSFGDIRVVGCDSVASKVRLSRQRMEAAGLSEAVSCVAFDATRLAEHEGLPEALAGEFGAVLVDAPCSGTGTMRRHPEIPWALEERSLRPEEEGSLPQLQRSLLGAAASHVAPGGSLVYATCSVLPAENLDVVRGFLASPAGAGFELADVCTAPGVTALPEGARGLVAGCVEGGVFQSYPAPGSFDGHFCARLVRA